MRTILHVLQLMGVGGVQELVYNIVCNLPKDINRVVVFSYKGANDYYINLLKENNIKLIVSPYNVNDIRNIFVLKKVVDDEQIDIIHVHNTKPQIQCSVLLALNKKLKGVVTEHSMTSKRRNYVVFKLIDNFTYSQYDKIISVSKSVQDVLEPWLSSISRKKFGVIYNGVDINKIHSYAPSPRNAFSLNPDDYLISSVGRLREGKGFDTIIKALKFLPENYKLVIVGDGPLRTSLEELTVNEKVKDRIVFTGSSNSVPSLLKMTDLYVSASHTEGFGLTVIEAIVSGLPVICTRIPAFKELLDDDVLFDVGNSEQLASLILKHKSIDNKKYEDCYCIKSMVEQYNELYQELA